MKERLICLMLVIGGMLAGQIALAEGTSIGISPLTFELTGNPGDVIENYLKVYNPSDNDTITVKIEVEDIAPTGEQGFVRVEPPETETYSLARWIKTEPNELVLQPREEKAVKFTITIPDNAEPGGHYGTVLAGTKGVAGPGLTGATIVKRIGSLVLLTIPGEMKESLAIEGFSAPVYSEYGPINFTAKFENSGTVHAKPSALVTITDFWGRKVAELKLIQGNVLPGAVRKFEVSWDKKFLFGGRYVATLSGNYGTGNRPLSPSVITFWAFPWKVGLGMLLIFILLILIRKRLWSAFRILIRGS